MEVKDLTQKATEELFIEKLSTQESSLKDDQPMILERLRNLKSGVCARYNLLKKREQRKFLLLSVMIVLVTWSSVVGLWFLVW
jgi:hypothetical protein